MRCDGSPPSASASSRQRESEDQGNDKDGSLDEILSVVWRVHHRQALEQNANEQRAHSRAKGVRLGNTQNGKTDQSGSAGMEKEMVDG